MNQSTRIPFRINFNTNISATLGTVTITEFNLTIANLGDRIVNAGDTFMLWRLRELKVYQELLGGTFLNSTVSVSSLPGNYLHGLAFIPISNSYYAAPTTSIQYMDFPESKLISGAHKVSIYVRSNGLMGSSMFKWLTTNTTSDADQQSAGTLSVFTLSSSHGDDGAQGTTRGVLEGVAEFRSPIDTALIPSSLRQRNQRTASNQYGMVPNRITMFEEKVNGLPPSLEEKFSDMDLGDPVDDYGEFKVISPPQREQPMNYRLYYDQLVNTVNSQRPTQFWLPKRVSLGGASRPPPSITGFKNDLKEEKQGHPPK